MDQTEDGVTPLQLCRHGITGWWRRVRREWSLLTQFAVRPVAVVMGDVFGEYTFEMSRPEDQHPVEALPTLWVPRKSSGPPEQAFRGSVRRAPGFQARSDSRAQK